MKPKDEEKGEQAWDNPKEAAPEEADKKDW